LKKSSMGKQLRIRILHPFRSSELIGVGIGKESCIGNAPPSAATIGVNP
jgi:hypothetical protein